MKRVILILTLFAFSCTVSFAESVHDTLARLVKTNATHDWGDEYRKGSHANDETTISGYYWEDTNSLYLGEFNGSEMHGYGIYILPEGYNLSNCPGTRYYAGYYKNGIMEGKGTCYNSDGEIIYYGEFKNDKPVETYPSTSSFAAYGFAMLKYENGDIYAGEIKDEARQGNGVYIWEDDSSMHIGWWEKGKQDGLGIVISLDGSYVEGDWEMGSRTKTYLSYNANNSNNRSSSSSSTMGYRRNSDGTTTMTVPGYTSTSDPNTGFYTSKIMCAICSGTGYIQGMNPLYGMGAADAIRYGTYNMQPMYTQQICFMCNGVGYTIHSGYNDPSAGSSGGSSGYSGGSGSGSSGYRNTSHSVCYGTGKCPTCNGKGIADYGKYIGRSAYDTCTTCGGDGLCNGCNGTGVVLRRQ